MDKQFLSILRCPKTKQTLEVMERDLADGPDVDEWLVTADGKRRYSVKSGIPRFVSETNYADSFGMQWDIYRETQLDTFSGYPISARRFWSSTQWDPGELKDRWILDVGCGSGRFAETALSAGGKVVALDYSNAVDACRLNFHDWENIFFVQGDIYALPFAEGFFPFIYSLGVLQHTPDVKKAFVSLPPLLRPGGRLCVDYYSKTWKSSFLPKYLLRPFTRKISSNRLFKILKILVPILFPVTWILGKVPGGRLFKRIIPVADPLYEYERCHNDKKIPYKRRVEWSLLDTFDWFAPTYDNPPTRSMVAGWMQELGMRHVKIEKLGHLVSNAER